MVRLLARYQVHLPRSKEMDAAAAYGESAKIDHVRARTVDEDAYFVIIMAVGLLRLVRIFPVPDGLALYFINIKGDLFIAFGKFVDVDVLEHFDSQKKGYFTLLYRIV